MRWRPALASYDARTSSNASQRTSARLRTPLSAVAGARYVVNGEEFVLYAVRRGQLVLRSTANVNAFICEQVSGPLLPERWRR